MAQQRLPSTPDAQTIARWRYDQIVEALGDMAHDVRGEIIARISAAPVRWPRGASRPISAATLYRWIERYRHGGLVALRPRRRKDRGKLRARLPEDVVARARAILEEDPEISYTLLSVLLTADAKLRLRARGIVLSKSTLQRRLAADPHYTRLQRGRRLARRRTRFVARAPHDIWHLDAKGPVTISLRGRKKLVFHILTVLDDASRATLASLIVLTPDLCAAVRAFRLAAERWGLPARVYADRASIFDSHAFRAIVDAIVVGSGTVLADDPHLTVRDADDELAEHQPLRVVLDRRHRVHQSAQVLDNAAETLLLDTAVPRFALKALHDRGVRHVLLEGGPTLAGAFVEARCVDEVIAYVAPKLLGAGPSALGDAGISTIADAISLDVDTVTRVGGDVKIVARPIWSEGE